MNIENNVTELKYFSYDLSDDYCKNKKAPPKGGVARLFLNTCFKCRVCIRNQMLQTTC